MLSGATFQMRFPISLFAFLFLFSPVLLWAQDSTQGARYYEQARRLNTRGLVDSSVRVYLKAIVEFKKEKRYDRLYMAYGNIVLPLYASAKFNEMYAYSDSALMLVEEHELGLEKKLGILHNRASIYEKLGMPEKKVSTLRNILRLLPDTVKNNLRVVVNLGLAAHHANNSTEAGALDSAVFYSMNAYSVSSSLKDTHYLGISSTYLGMSMSRQGSYPDDIVNKYFSFARNTFESGPYASTYELCNTLQIWGKAYYFSKQYRKALEILVEPEKLARKYNYHTHLLSVVEAKANSHEALGNYEKAIKLHHKYYRIKDSVDAEQNKAEFARLEAQLQTREKTAQLKLSKAQNLVAQEENKRLYYIVFSLLVVCLSVVVTAVVSIRNRKRMAAMKEEELRLELKHKELKEEQLRDKIDFKSRQLTSKALELSRLAETLQQFIEQAKEISGKEGEEALEQLGLRWDRKVNALTSWGDFNLAFEEVHPSFFQKLMILQPDLTDKEKRLMAFAKLGLSIKETANLLGIEPNSVKTARYRLKKKFDLGTEQSLEVFVSDI